MDTSAQTIRAEVHALTETLDDLMARAWQQAARIRTSPLSIRPPGFHNKRQGVCMDRDWPKSDPEGTARCMRPPEFNNAMAFF